jgi:hypothetical protein
MSKWLNFAQWDSFLTKIRNAEESFSNSETLWYRGHSKSSYELVPSLFRFPKGKLKERDLFEKYKQIAVRVFPKRKDDWELLFDMQHHYVPTRLLDWTEVLGIAVFFALLDVESDDAAVFILDPKRLNGKSYKNRIPLVSEDKEFDYEKIYLDKQPLPPKDPIAIEVPFQNKRITAQKGKFTIHGDDEKPLDVLYPDCVKKITLPVNAFKGAKEFLRISGINEFSVFPDIVGLAPFIKNIVNLH